MTRSQRSQQRRRQEQLSIAPIAKPPYVPTIGLGSVVIVEDLETGEMEMVQVVIGQNPLTGVRATTGEFVNAPLDAPFGRALVGHKVGDLIMVQSEWGYTKYRVVDFEAAPTPDNRQQASASMSKALKDEGQLLKHERADKGQYGGRTKDAQVDIPHRDEGHLDGGRFIGFLARESGGFGSYPGYDDMGDESSP